MTEQPIDGNQTQLFREKRLWLERGKYKHSGKPDCVVISGRRALLIDFKCGRNEIEESPSNLQLRDLAVLIAAYYNVGEVTVCIIQPLVSAKPALCVYTIADIVRAKDEMWARIIASHAPDAKRTPGAGQCQYCRAAHWGKCAEYNAWAGGLLAEIFVAK